MSGAVNWPAGVVQTSHSECRAWQQQKTGNIAALVLRKDRLRPPSPGEVRIRVKAVGLNFADVFTTLGLYAAAPKENVTPGLEFSGVVEEVGAPQPNASQPKQEGTQGTALRVGDRVMGVTRFGAFADRLNAQVKLLQPIPEGWTFREGAAFLVQGLTAMYGLRDQGNLGRRMGQCVLVHSAAGGCGQFALGICRKHGAQVIATVGSEGKVSYLQTKFPWLTREQIIVRDASRFGFQLTSALAAAERRQGFDIILDAVSGEYFSPGFNLLAPGGRYVIYGAANWTPSGDRPGWLRLASQYLRRPRLDPLQMIGQNRSLMAFNLIYLFDRAEELRGLATELQDMRLPPPSIAATFDFEDAQAALGYLQSGEATGKVVLSVEDD